MGNARNLADLLGTSTKANQVISTSGAITTTGAFTSLGIDDNADANAITITSAEAVGIGTSLTPNNYSGYQVLTIGGSNATTGSALDFEDSSGNIEGYMSGTAGRVYIDADPSNGNATSWIHLGVDGNSVVKLDHYLDAIITSVNLLFNSASSSALCVSANVSILLCVHSLTSSCSCSEYNVTTFVSSSLYPSTHFITKLIPVTEPK